MKSLVIQFVGIPVIFLLCLFSVFYSGRCQTRFEGIIRYQLFSSNNPQENMPQKIEYFLKDDNLMFRVFTTENNELARILFNGDEQAIFMIDDIQKTAIKWRIDEKTDEQPGVVPDQYKETYSKAIEEQAKKNQIQQQNIEDTGETENIAGYDCTKYKVNHTDHKKQSTGFAWLAEEIYFDLPGNINVGENPLFQFIGYSGFPLKFEMYEEGQVIMQLKATEVIRKKLHEELFTLPPGYKISEMSSLMKGN
jgi:hypothetical protein